MKITYEQGDVVLLDKKFECVVIGKQTESEYVVIEILNDRVVVNQVPGSCLRYLGHIDLYDHIWSAIGRALSVGQREPESKDNETERSEGK